MKKIKIGLLPRIIIAIILGIAIGTVFPAPLRCFQVFSPISQESQYSHHSSNRACRSKK